jgi:hypothetical protein
MKCVNHVNPLHSRVIARYEAISMLYRAALRIGDY